MSLRDRMLLLDRMAHVSEATAAASAARAAELVANEMAFPIAEICSVIPSPYTIPRSFSIEGFYVDF